MTDKAVVTYVYWCEHREFSYPVRPSSDGTYHFTHPVCRECGMKGMMTKSVDGKCVHCVYKGECKWCGEINPFGDV